MAVADLLLEVPDEAHRVLDDVEPIVLHEGRQVHREAEGVGLVGGVGLEEGGVGGAAAAPVLPDPASIAGEAPPVDALKEARDFFWSRECNPKRN